MSNKEDFVRLFNEHAALVHVTAKNKGWWDKERNDGEIIVTQGDETKVDVRVIPAPGNWQNELSSYRHAIFVCQVLDQ